MHGVGQILKGAPATEGSARPSPCAIHKKGIAVGARQASRPQVHSQLFLARPKSLGVCSWLFLEGP